MAPRYGSSVVGGAETLCRLLAENLTAHGTPIDVLTTCATNHFTWDNDLPPSDGIEGGVRVRRFPVGPRDGSEFARLHAAIDRGVRLPYPDQVRWMAESVWAPGILSAVPEYEWIIAMPYLFGTSFWTVAADPDRSILIPCLHDERHARQAVVLDSLCAAKGLMLNAGGEQRLVERLLESHRAGTAHLRSSPVVVGCGFDEEPLPEPTAARAFCDQHGVEPGYLLYAGRRELAKGVGVMFDHYRLYRQQVRDPRPLALMGSGDTQPPHDLTPFVIDLGFVPERERALAYAAASVLIQPSKLESFGMVVFEAWLAGTPVLVNSASDVLREHCEASGGGLWFNDGPTFVEALGLMTESPIMLEALARAGRAYALTEFRWTAVRKRFTSALEAWS